MRDVGVGNGHLLHVNCMMWDLLAVLREQVSCLIRTCRTVRHRGGGSRGALKFGHLLVCLYVRFKLH